jgi:hypothetical protein
VRVQKRAVWWVQNLVVEQVKKQVAGLAVSQVPRRVAFWVQNLVVEQAQKQVFGQVVWRVPQLGVFSVRKPVVSPEKWPERCCFPSMELVLDLHIFLSHK